MGNRNVVLKQEGTMKKIGLKSEALNGYYHEIYLMGDDPEPAIQTGFSTAYSTSIAIASNGTYYVIAGHFDVGVKTYAFAKSRAHFTPKYIFIHNKEVAPSSIRSVFITYTYDGINWTINEEMKAADWIFGGENLFDPVSGNRPNKAFNIYHNGVVWVGVGSGLESGRNPIAVSRDGVNWSSKACNVRELKAITWNGENWIVGGVYNVYPGNSNPISIGMSYYSNGVSWDYSTNNGLTKRIQHLVYMPLSGGNGRFIANGYRSDNKIYFSTSDVVGSNIPAIWTQRQEISVNQPIWDGARSRWVAPNNDGYYSGIQSTDGITWSAMNIPSTGNSNGGLAFLASDDGTLLYLVATLNAGNDTGIKLLKRNASDTATWTTLVSLGNGTNSMVDGKVNFLSALTQPYLIPPI